MENTVLPKVWQQGQRLTVDDLSGCAFTGENAAHTFEISGKNASGAVAISGTIAGKFLRSDNVTVPVTGSSSDGVASITLTDDCYVVPGRFIFSVYANDGTHNICIYCGVGNVLRTDSGEYEGGEIITDVTALINAIETAIATIPADYSTLLAAIAPTFSASTAYPAGSYVWYDGTLYRFTADHAAGSWTGTDAAAVALAGDVADLKSAVKQSEIDIYKNNSLFNGVTITETDISWHVGYITASGENGGEINDGLPSGENYYIYSDLIEASHPIPVSATDGAYIRFFVYNSQSGEYIGGTNNYAIPHNETLIAGQSYRLQFLVSLNNTMASAENAIANISDYLSFSAQKYDAPINAVKLHEIGVPIEWNVVWNVGSINPNTGVASQNTAYGGNYHVYSDPIQSEYGYYYSAFRNIRLFKYRATDNQYIGGTNWQTAPIKGSIESSKEYYYRIQMFGDTTISAAQNILNNIDSYIEIDQTNAAEHGWIEFLPITDVYIGDVQQRIYFNEIARYNDKEGYFVVTASGATYPEITYTDRYIEFVPSGNKNIDVTISYYKNDRISETKTITVHCKTTAFSTKKIMFIGDSYTEQGGMVKWLKDHNGENVVLYGTRETTIDGVTYKTEGRSGWTAGNYISSASVGNVTNPFYNPSTQTFDFAYYMSNAGSNFTDVEIVNILLGRNSGFPVGNMDNLDIIVSSIKSYNPDIIVVLMCDNNLAADNTAAGKYMQNVHTADRQSHIYNTAFYERYKNNANVVMCFQNLNIDNVYDWATEEVDASIVNDKKITVYTDNVHPAVLTGQQKFGIALNGLLRNILN